MLRGFLLTEPLSVEGNLTSEPTPLVQVPYHIVWRKMVFWTWLEASSEIQGSQSGLEKGRDESFQVQVKETQGTESHRTICKNLSGCQLLIGHKKCFVLLFPIGEQFLLSSFREYTCPVRSPSLCVQG